MGGRRAAASSPSDATGLPSQSNRVGEGVGVGSGSTLPRLFCRLTAWKSYPFALCATLDAVAELDAGEEVDVIRAAGAELGVVVEGAHHGSLRSTGAAK